MSSEWSWQRSRVVSCGPNVDKIKKLNSSYLRVPPSHALRKSSNSHRLPSAGTARGTGVCLPTQEPLSAALGSKRTTVHAHVHTWSQFRVPDSHFPTCTSVVIVRTGAVAVVQSGTVLLLSHSSSPHSGASRPLWTRGSQGGQMGGVWDERLMQKSSHVWPTSGPTLSPIRGWTETQPQETITPAQKNRGLDGWRLWLFLLLL